LKNGWVKFDNLEYHISTASVNDYVLFKGKNEGSVGTEVVNGKRVRTYKMLIDPKNETLDTYFKCRKRNARKTQKARGVDKRNDNK